MNIISSTPCNHPSLKFPPKSPQNKPNSTLSLLQLCTNLQELTQLHSLLIKTSLIRHTSAFGRLLSSLTNSKNLDYAQKLFEFFPFPKNTFMYNVMIKAYSRNTNPTLALLMYSQMIGEDYLLPDEFTFTFLLTACSRLCALSEGKQAHAQMVKYPFRVGIHSRNSLINFYAKIGEFGLVGARLFNEIKDPDIVSWNCLLDGFVKSGNLDSAKEVFDQIPFRDVVSWTIMLVGYTNAGLLNEACRLFDEMPQRNLVSWSAMINGYVRMGQYKEALGLFKEMQDVKVEVDSITMTSLLSACASLGALEQGRWIRDYIKKQKIKVDVLLEAALVDMYAKCGEIDIAISIFRKAADKRVSLWNAILGGLAMHSRGTEAVELFSEMLRSGTQPNEITFISVLSACSHSGLITNGLKIFHAMGKDHHVKPTIEHYSCMVDLLSRAGLLYEAKKFIERMPMEADGNILRALLGACRLHGDVELGEQVGRTLIELEPSNDGNYVLLSNVYAMGNRWKDVARLRKEMKERGIRKTPGCSSIELKGVVHEFVAGDCSHTQSKEIYLRLDEMAEHLLVAGL